MMIIPTLISYENSIKFTHHEHKYYDISFPNYGKIVNSCLPHDFDSDLPIRFTSSGGSAIDIYFSEHLFLQSISIILSNLDMEIGISEKERNKFLWIERDFSFIINFLSFNDKENRILNLLPINKGIFLSFSNSEFPMNFIGERDKWALCFGKNGIFCGIWITLV